MKLKRGDLEILRKSISNKEYFNVIIPKNTRLSNVIVYVCMIFRYLSGDETQEADLSTCPPLKRYTSSSSTLPHGQ